MWGSTGRRASVVRPRPDLSRTFGCASRHRAPSDGQGNLFDSSAPMLDRLEPAAAAGRLSYSALSVYSGCHYRFYVERVIGLEAPSSAQEQANEPTAGESPPSPDELSAPEAGPRERALAIGNAVHALLERSAHRSWASPGATEIETALGRQGLGGDRDARDRVRTLVEGWLGSDLRAELEARGARMRPEVPFVLGLAGTVVRGKIDLLAEAGGAPLVVDYKTDALCGRDPDELAESYRTQRDLYALAAHAASPNGAAAAVRAAYCFLEAPERASVEVYDEADLAAARERLERLVAGIRAGDFARTDSPHAALCHGCPAAARLCGKPAWRPQWAVASTP